MGLNRREIPRFARNDKINYFFRTVISRPAAFLRCTGEQQGPAHCPNELLPFLESLKRTIDWYYKDKGHSYAGAIFKGMLTEC